MDAEEGRSPPAAAVGPRGARGGTGGSRNVTRK